jgi:hypothetical protein
LVDDECSWIYCLKKRKRKRKKKEKEKDGRNESYLA